MNFFFSQAERESFVSFCFTNNFEIVPNLHYVDSAYYVVKTLEHYLKYMNECVGFFIVHESYQQYPLEMDFFEKEDQKEYYIMNRYGGPYIDFYTPIFAEKKDDRIGPGLMSIYPSYYHYNEEFLPTDELKKAYQRLSSYIRKAAIKVKIGKKTYWVGNYTIEKVKQGELKFVEMDGFNWEDLLR